MGISVSESVNSDFVFSVIKDIDISLVNNLLHQSACNLGSNVPVHSYTNETEQYKNMDNTHVHSHSCGFDDNDIMYVNSFDPASTSSNSSTCNGASVNSCASETENRDFVDDMLVNSNSSTLCNVNSYSSTKRNVHSNSSTLCNVHSNSSNICNVHSISAHLDNMRVEPDPCITM